MREFNLSHNQLSGTLPTELANLQIIDRLTSENNSFYGTIPTEYGHLQRIREFNAGDNKLTGSFPGELGDDSLWRTMKFRWMGWDWIGEILGEMQHLEQYNRLDNFVDYLPFGILANVSEFVSFPWLPRKLVDKVRPSQRVCLKFNVTDEILESVCKERADPMEIIIPRSRWKPYTPARLQNKLKSINSVAASNLRRRVRPEQPAHRSIISYRP